MFLVFHLMQFLHDVDLFALAYRIEVANLLTGYRIEKVDL